jgi:uncharacterized Zn finger protein
MPREIDEAFQSAGASLFPRKRDDLRTDCDCPDYGDPCKHIAAVHYVLGDALDRDPFLLFELRGRTREQVLSALGEARASEGGTRRREPKRTAKPTDVVERPPSVALLKLDAKTYDAAPAPLPALSFSFDPPSAHAAVLRQLGAPGSWNREAPPAESLAPVVRAAAQAARRLALNDPETSLPPSGTPAPLEPKKKPPRKVSPRRR